MQDWTNGFYKKMAWVKCRAAFLRSKFYVCNRCGGAATIAHHTEKLTPENIGDPDVTYNWDKLEALCQTCHNREHAARGKYMFDDDGNIVPR